MKKRRVQNIKIFRRSFNVFYFIEGFEIFFLWIFIKAYDEL